ncbi:hypothetical protein PMAYCL1PPCAC_10834, partial [Pristionchus mayeri]
SCAVRSSDCCSGSGRGSIACNSGRINCRECCVRRSICCRECRPNGSDCPEDVGEEVAASRERCQLLLGILLRPARNIVQSSPPSACSNESDGSSAQW